MIFWIIGIILYVVIAFVTYKFVFGPRAKGEETSATVLEAVWYSAFWPATLLLELLFKLFSLFQKDK